MSLSKTYTGDAPQRVNKFMGQSGLCSRREAEALIENGKVEIDGDVISSPGHKILPGQTLTLKSDAAAKLETKFTAVIHKPVGIVSAQPEEGQVPAARLLTRSNLSGTGRPPPRNASLPALGRLDMDSRGLLLLSEDGVLAKAIIGPESKLEKEYVVKVKGDVTPERLTKLRHGLALDHHRLKPAKVAVMDSGRLRFTLREGRNRQIRRMCELVDLRVVDLLRVRIGPLKLGGLKEGKWRPLSKKERAALLRL
ncbi:MAG: pseudouridine synthase [Pseudomonadota bacterium]